MSITSEELKKIINEQDAALIIKAKQQALNHTEKLAFNKLQQRLIDDEGMNKLPSVDILQSLYEKSKVFESKSTDNKAIEAIFAKFAEDFGTENIQNNGLCFQDDHDNSKANTFFSQQAEAGHEFLFQQGTNNHYAFSDGQGHYKMGTKEAIMAYCKNESIKPPPYFQTEADNQDEYTSHRSPS